MLPKPGTPGRNREERDSTSHPQHLSQISTIWTQVVRAHSHSADKAAAAQTALVERYHGAVYNYLLGALRDRDGADELFQEFALRLVRGDFGRADPERGRFRDYVKTTLINLVINQRKKAGRVRFLDAGAPEPAADPPDQFDSDREFLTSWRKAVLDRAWEALAAGQKPAGPRFHDVLRARTENPSLSSAQLTEKLNAELKPAEPFTDANLRKVLQRARDQFTDLLVEEVARSLQSNDAGAIEQELIDLGLHTHCRRALARRRRE